MSAASLSVAVLMGGPSSEAEVSRSSAAQVAQALTANGHRVSRLELDTQVHRELDDLQPDVVFPVLHGPPGEDGTVQGLLEMMNLPYVGSGVQGSATAMDKSLAKALYRLAELPVADDLLLSATEDPLVASQRVQAELGNQVVVKPNAQGSAIGVTRVTEAAALVPAIESALARGAGALVEQYVRGKEITVGVLDLHDEAAIAFPVVEVRTAANQWYDFHNRYAAGESEHVIPADLPSETNATLQQIALRAHDVLGLRDLSRSDFIVAADGQIVLLETNTLPGMTPTSLYPDGAAAIGLGFEALMQRLVTSAVSRGRPLAQHASSAIMALPRD